MCTRCGKANPEPKYRQCPDCRKRQAESMARWREKNRGHSAKYQRDWRRRLRRQVFDGYGGKCACCSEERYEFLSLDHVQGGGRAHAREVGASDRMYRWAINNGYPATLQVLCFNCNFARNYSGYCPCQNE